MTWPDLREILMLNTRAWLAIGFVVGAAATASAQQFTPVSYPDAILTTAYGINPQGDIVGQYESSDGRAHGYVLNGSRFHTIDPPGAILTFAFGINGRGEIVGRYDTNDGRTHGFLKRQNTYLAVDVPGAIRTV